VAGPNYLAAGISLWDYDTNVVLQAFLYIGLTKIKGEYAHET